MTTARDLFNIGRWAAEILVMFGLIIAEFGGLRSLGFLLVLLGLVAAGGAASMAVIVHQQSRQES